MSSDKTLKTIVITGGATGIGFATAKALAEKGGYRIVLIGRRKAHLESAAKHLGDRTDLINTYICDLKDPDQTQAIAEKILHSHKSIYGLVNNAGVYPFGTLENTDLKSWDETFNVNLKAPFLLCQILSKGMKRDGGRIVNISSTAGILSAQFALAYSVSKAALIQLTKTTAKELGKHGITVNCVCPGIVRSPLHEGYHQNQSQLEQFYAKKGASYPLGRVGEPEDVASAILYYLSEEASWITGDVMIMDGGRLLT